MGFLRGQVEELDDDEMNFPPEPSAVGKETRPSKDPHSVEYLREKCECQRHSCVLPWSAHQAFLTIIMVCRRL